MAQPFAVQDKFTQKTRILILSIEKEVLLGLKSPLVVTWYYIFVIIDVVFYFLSMMQRNWAYDCKHFLNCCKWLCAEKADLKANLLVCLTTFSRAYDKMWKWSCNQKLAIHKAKWHKRYYSPFHSENLCNWNREKVWRGLGYIFHATIREDYQNINKNEIPRWLLKGRIS